MMKRLVLVLVMVLVAGCTNKATAERRGNPPPKRTTTTRASTTTTSTVPAPTTTASPSQCAGVAVAPGQLTQPFVDTYPTGTTFCLSAGTFAMTAAVEARTGDRFIGAGPDTVLDGGHTIDSALIGFCCSTGSNVVVSDLVVQNFTSSTIHGAIKAGYGWTIERVESRFNRLGMELNSGTTLRDSYVHDNTQYGLFGAGDGTQVLDNEVARNNTGNYDKGDAGAMKFCCRTTKNVLIRGNNFHDNNGDGIWIDGGGANIVVDRNTVTGNSDTGIILEIVASGTISNNTVTGNASNFVGYSCWWGAGIMANTSPNVEVYGNVVESGAGANGICAIDYSRSDAFGPLTNFYVHDNIVKTRAPAMTGIVGNPAAFDAASNNRFTENTYYVTAPSDAAWAWSSYPLDWNEWQSAGQDTTSGLLLW